LAAGALLGALTLTALKHLGECTLVVDEDNNLCPTGAWRASTTSCCSRSRRTTAEMH
jgi:hypothetical protein